MVSMIKIDSPLIVASPPGMDLTSPQGPEFSAILNGALNNVQNPETTVNSGQPEQPVLVMPDEQNLNPENAVIEEEVSDEINLSDTKPEEKEESAQNPEMDLPGMNYPVYILMGLSGLAANTPGFENPGVLQGENSAKVSSQSQGVSLSESSRTSHQVPFGWVQAKAADAGVNGQPALGLSEATSEVLQQTVQPEAIPQAGSQVLNLQDAPEDLDSGLQPEGASAENQSLSDASGLNLSEIPENPRQAGAKPYGDIGGRLPDEKPAGEFKTHTQPAERHERAEFTVLKTGQPKFHGILEFNEESAFEFQPISLKADEEIKAAKQPEGIGADKLAGLQFARFNIPTAVSVEKSGGANPSAPMEVPVYEQVFDGVKVNLDLGRNSFSIKLKPEGLGELQVKMTMDDGKVILELNTSLASTRDLISSQINELKSALASNSIHVTDFTVNCTGETNPGLFSFDSFGRGFGRDTGRQAYYEDQPEYYADSSEYKGKVSRAVFVPGRLNYKI
ncbi:MAG TPA: hypothetical protein GXX54_03995 [Clostridiales bacterium]|nr:hypothetical protein [Clostridiales bacterium]